MSLVKNLSFFFIVTQQFNASIHIKVLTTNIYIYPCQSVKKLKYIAFLLITLTFVTFCGGYQSQRSTGLSDP